MPGAKDQTLLCERRSIAQNQDLKCVLIRENMTYHVVHAMVIDRDNLIKILSLEQSWDINSYEF